ncbi:hypothetical protein DACRYDRAFT_100897 [Dacryopinax primogenitus]|uniref:Uncharacterized protein n=1 Tax=Dacryopinax primogenitus (strain DJM 731) TaxID=1858805 RepID=M5G938_DACPD|nr:uncharacterized protein DACRYDRAFT_100897 [Dacryopinax primogenitus]EJU00303.1 hypothetical protein DACRYDRAFT_100897 [Dacryopinax primogenitus]
MASPSTTRSSVATSSRASATSSRSVFTETRLSAVTKSTVSSAQISSTPMRSSTSGITTTKHTHMTVDGVVRDELGHALYRNCSIENILQSISDLDDAQLLERQELARDLAQKFSEDEELKCLEENYLRQSLEPQAYVPFCELVNAIIDHLGIEGDNRFLAIGQKNMILAHGMGDQKSDVVFVTKSVYDVSMKKLGPVTSGSVVSSSASLEHHNKSSNEVETILDAARALGFVEMKWEKRKRSRTLATASKRTPRPAGACTSQRNSDQPSKSSLSDRSKLQATATKRARSPSADGTLPSKRKKSPNGYTTTPAQPISPFALDGPGVIPPTGSEVQLGGYAMKGQSDGCFRQWTVARSLAVHWFQSLGLHSHHIVGQREHFMLLLLLFTSASPSQLGMNTAIKDTIDADVGRGTTAYRTRFASEDVVVMVCFPPKTRKSEVEFIARFRQHADIMDMVPKVFAHSTIEMPDFLELVLRSKSKPKVEPDVRQMRVFVMKRYQTLSEVTSADDLLSIIRDIGRYPDSKDIMGGGTDWLTHAKGRLNGLEALFGIDDNTTVAQ